MLVSMAQEAAMHLQNFLTKRGKSIGLRLGFAAMLVLCANNAHAKTLRFSDPIRYESDGKVWSVKEIPYAQMAQRLGKPTSLGDACIWGYVDYPNISFYDIDATPQKVIVAAIRFKTARDKVVFSKFVVNQDTPLSFVKKFHPNRADRGNGVTSYMVNMPGLKKGYDGYGYVFDFKDEKLIEFSLWKNLC